MSDLNSVIRNIRPCDCNEPYVFISYSSTDRELVWRDVLEFQKRGYNVWLDEKNLDKTKDSWKEDALTAIEDMDCMLLVFYVSAASLRSDACYQELSKTVADGTRALHFGPVKFIAIDAEAVGDIKLFHQQVFEEIRNSNLDKEERRKQALALNGFMQQFFNSNNEKVRIHPKNEENRKMDYYEEILASFPDETRIYPDEEAVEGKKAEAGNPVAEARIKQEKQGEEKGQKAKQSEGKAKEPEQKEKQGESEAKEPEQKEKQGEGEAEEVPSVTETTPAVEEKISVESEVKEASLTDHFTHYEERPQNRKYGRNIFRKKNIEEAQQGGGIYRLVTGYTKTETKVFGSIFGGREDIVQMELPDSIEELNSGEFKDCMNMERIKMPKYLEKISFEAFKGCSSLKCVEVPGNVTVIDSRAFQGCSSLGQVKLPEGLKEMGMSAFENCYSLEELFLPSSLEEMELSCCANCTSLKEITIPGSVKKISSHAFEGCTALQKVVVEEGVEDIEAAFGNCGKSLEIWIPASVSKISGIAFYKSAVTIHCDSGSYAHQYAEKEGIAYTLN